MECRRTPKRTRQACEPCRRKKSRCPGERPVCSHCRRLGQSCRYASNSLGESSRTPDRSNSDLERRMRFLESKFDKVIQDLGRTERRSNPPDISETQHPESTPPSWMSDARITRHSSRKQHSEILDLRECSLLEVGHLYVTWCHNQPLSLFDKDTFPESLVLRDWELQLAVRALSLRFPPSTITDERRETLCSLAKEARRLAMGRVIEGTVELSTLQTLCILSLIEFTQGSSVQAGLNLTIAQELAQSLDQGNTLGDQKESQDCVAAIRLLQKLQSPVLPSIKSPHIFSGSGAPVEPWTLALPGPSSSAQDRSEAGISWYSAYLGDAWQMARQYAAARIDNTQQLPPWNPHSDYAAVMQRHHDFDSRVPMRYRYHANKFGDETMESLQLRRDYWGPWLFMQIMHAAIPCLINHPFLLSMRLRGFRRMIPQMFIHQSFEHVTRCCGWIVFFLNLVERQGFEVSDPSLAHCVVIVATIHLQHSFVKDGDLRRKAREGLNVCMKFLRRMGLIWPDVANMANNLQRLQDSVVGVASPITEEQDDDAQQQKWSINAQLLRDLLIYERAGRKNAASDQSIFGTSFLPAPTGNIEEEDVNDFDLVGSVGISAHRSAPKAGLLYAPEDEAKTTSMSAGAGVVGDSVEDRIFEGVTGWSEQDSLFLQADDFGRAIDNWLDLDMDCMN